MPMEVSEWATSAEFSSGSRVIMLIVPPIADERRASSAHHFYTLYNVGGDMLKAVDPGKG